MTAGFNQNVLRISCQNSVAVGEPYQEYWLDFNLKIWTGPHTFPAALIQSYQAATGADTGHGFLLVGAGISNKLWLSGVNPLSSDVYVENGSLLSWAYQTVLLPDNQEMSQNRMGQTAITLSLPGGQSIGISFINEIGTTLNQIQLSGPGSSPMIWGSSDWGAAVWGGIVGYLREYNIPWTTPIIFKQGSILVVGASQASFAIGNLYMKYQPLGYLLNVLGAAI